MIVVGGPNGAGKTTLARQLVLEHLPDAFTFLNADIIAEGMSPFKPQRVATKAGKEFLKRFDSMARNGESFVVEATLSGKSLARRLTSLKNIGYRIEVAYLWLPCVRVAVDRVAKRVKQGGHSIPETTIRRHFDRLYPNFCSDYLPIADEWRLLNGALTPPAEVVRRKSGVLEVLDPVMLEEMNLKTGELDWRAEESGTSYAGGQNSCLGDLGAVLEAVGRQVRELELMSSVLQ